MYFSQTKVYVVALCRNGSRRVVNGLFFDDDCELLAPGFAGPLSLGAFSSRFPLFSDNLLLWPSAQSSPIGKIRYSLNNQMLNPSNSNNSPSVKTFLPDVGTM